MPASSNRSATAAPPRNRPCARLRRRRRLHQLDDLEALNYDDLGAVAKLTASPHYSDVMAVRG